MTPIRGANINNRTELKTLVKLLVELTWVAIITYFFGNRTMLKLPICHSCAI